jgi:hypothetical protein
MHLQRSPNVPTVEPRKDIHRIQSAGNNEFRVTRSPMLLLSG